MIYFKSISVYLEVARIQLIQTISLVRRDTVSVCATYGFDLTIASHAQDCELFLIQF